VALDPRVKKAVEAAVKSAKFQRELELNASDACSKVDSLFGVPMSNFFVPASTVLKHVDEHLLLHCLQVATSQSLVLEAHSLAKNKATVVIGSGIFESFLYSRSPDSYHESNLDGNAIEFIHSNTTVCRELGWTEDHQKKVVVGVEALLKEEFGKLLALIADFETFLVTS